MTHKLSLIVLGGFGSKIKQIHFSKIQIACVIAAVITCLGLSAYGCIDYLMMRSQIAAKHQLEVQLAAQNIEVALQREQIQEFASRINELKERIVALNHFEERIRVLANLDQADKEEGIFGIGGSAPEDLNPTIELNDSHRNLVKSMHRQVIQLGEASQKQHNAFAGLMDRLAEQENMLAHTPAIRPVKGWITSAFAYRQSPFTGKREFHKGIDIANHKGTSILATADGVVSFLGDNGSLGQVLVVDHGFGIITRYAHLQKGLKKAGDRVRRGEVIALLGNTGRSTGPHLHYEVRVNGLPVNPETYILD